MTEPDDDIERTLRRYRTADPPAGLRARVLTGAVGRRVGFRAWLPAAAALLAAVALHALATAVHQSVARAVDVSRDAARRVVIEEMTTFLGGGDDARREAERLASAAASDYERTVSGLSRVDQREIR